MIVSASNHQNSRKSGFSLIQLAVVIGLVFVLSLVIFPAISNASLNASLRAAGRRGEVIYKGITRVSVEREAVGLPSLWPSAKVYTNAVSGQIENLDFANSTDYFMYIYDYERSESPQHLPLFKDFHYGLLAGSGVSACISNVLHVNNNMWTIAKNIPKNAPDCLPVIVSRNLDASSLLSYYDQDSNEREFSFRSEFGTPFSAYGAVLVRKDGQMRYFSHKYRACLHTYKKEYFDLSVDIDGNQVKHPLTYLTPTSEVMPVGKGNYSVE